VNNEALRNNIRVIKTKIRKAYKLLVRKPEGKGTLMEQGGTATAVEGIYYCINS
jgi:hypothetical protein